jgi:hypothetical protein
MCINKSVLEGNESQRRKSDKPEEGTTHEDKGKEGNEQARLRMII